ncbi:hypothetical protein DUI87_10767 [Hirundo rustica rustica]|uniref:Uncharacterized protein n=1 Tax=Hirundo rustica rustica TaxID=333673 RepID=A0A3M0KJI2_HIRRU|nr:hypothetical protein DUI87_10767 [Hirundo rustica rustica]
MCKVHVSVTVWVYLIEASQSQLSTQVPLALAADTGWLKVFAYLINITIGYLIISRGKVGLFRILRFNSQTG